MASWGMNVMARLSVRSPRVRMSTPSMVMCPDERGASRSSATEREDLPASSGTQRNQEALK